MATSLNKSKYKACNISSQPSDYALTIRINMTSRSRAVRYSYSAIHVKVEANNKLMTIVLHKNHPSIASSKQHSIHVFGLFKCIIKNKFKCMIE